MKNKLIDRLKALFNRVFKTDSIRRIVGNAGYLVSAQGLAMVVSSVQQIFVLLIIGPAEYALIKAIQTFANNANRLTSFRINEMVVSYFRSYEEQGARDKAIAVYKLAGLLEMLGAGVAFILIWLLSPWGSEFFGGAPATQPLWLLFGTVVLLNFMLDSSRGLLQALNLFPVNAMINASQSVITFVLVLLVYFTKDGGLLDILMVYYLGKAFGALAYTAIGLKVAFRDWGPGWWRVRLGVLRGDLRGILNFSFNTNLTNTISMITRDSEALWISAILGLEAAGYYIFALSIAKQLQTPILSLANTAYPELSREIAHQRWAETKDILRRISRLGVFYSLPIIGLLLLFGKPFLSLVLPDWLSSYPLMVVLVLGFSFESGLIWNRVALLALKRATFPTVINLVGLGLKIGVIVLLVRQYGEAAFAWAMVAYMVFTVSGTALRAVVDIDQREKRDERLGTAG
ncbi:MAG: oligosaccharide flippase family protein [Chloroflexota bacterium]